MPEAYSIEDRERKKRNQNQNQIMKTIKTTFQQDTTAAALAAKSDKKTALVYFQKIGRRRKNGGRPVTLTILLPFRDFGAFELKADTAAWAGAAETIRAVIYGALSEPGGLAIINGDTGEELGQ